MTSTLYFVLLFWLNLVGSVWENSEKKKKRMIEREGEEKEKEKEKERKRKRKRKREREREKELGMEFPQACLLVSLEVLFLSFLAYFLILAVIVVVFLFEMRNILEIK